MEHYFIDTHCHLYSDEFKHDLSETMQDAARQNVRKFIFPAIDSGTHPIMLDVHQRFPSITFPMMGLHPCSVKGDYKTELAMVEKYLSDQNRPAYIGIGEIGLDHYWDKTHVREQLDAFTIQMGWALELELPIAIHTRNAMQETIEAVKPFAAKGLRGVFHCFGGSRESAEQIVGMGFLLGIGGVITYKNAGLPTALETISLDRLVLETDAPYLPPVPHRGKRNEPAYVPIIAEKLAFVKGTSVEEIAIASTRNAERLFDLG